MEAGNFKITEKLADDDFIDKKEKIWINLETTFKDIQNPAHFKRNEFLGYEDEISFQNMNEKKWDIFAWIGLKIPGSRQMTRKQKTNKILICDLDYEHAGLSG